MFASCDAEGVVKLWDLRNTKESAHYEVEARHAANKLSFDPSGKILAVACNSGSIKFLHTLDHSIKHEFKTNDDSCQAVLLDKSGDFLITSGSGKEKYISKQVLTLHNQRWNFSYLSIKKNKIRLFEIYSFQNVFKESL